MEVSGQLHAPATLPPGKSPRHLLDKMLGEPQSLSGLGGEETQFHHYPCQEFNLGRPASKLVSVLTELPHSFIHRQHKDSLVIGRKAKVVVVVVVFVFSRIRPLGLLRFRI
jgi:hypothetical protein